MTTGKRRTLMATAMVIMTSVGGREHKPKPTNTVPGIEYILADTAQPSDSDRPPINIGPPLDDSLAFRSEDIMKLVGSESREGTRMRRRTPPFC
jgi:hypothetical protein